MIKVECPGCKAPYQVDERRVPDAGLKMRCPKCATSFVVTKPGAGPPAPSPSLSPSPPKPAAAPKGPDVIADADWDLPLPTVDRAQPGAPPARARTAPVNRDARTVPDVLDLPAIASRTSQPGAPPAKAQPAKALAPPAAATPKPGGARAFGEIDLIVDLPAPDDSEFGDEELGVDLPVVRDDAPAHMGLPSVPTRVGLPTRPRIRPGAAEPPMEMAPPEALPPIPTLADLPARPRAKPVGAPPAEPPADAALPPIPTLVDLPARPRAKPAAAPAGRAKTQLFGDTVPDPAAAPLPSAAAAPIRVPIPARGNPAAPPAARPPAARASAPTPAPPPRSPDRASENDLEFQPEPLGFGEIDLPMSAGDFDLPSNAFGAGLPAPTSGAALPARPEAGLPLATANSALPLASDGTTLPTRIQRASTPMSDRFDRMRVSELNPDYDEDEPAVHGPGHIAGADIYTSSSAYDDRHMDPAFQTAARHVPAESDAGDEAPLMTTSGANVNARSQTAASPPARQPMGSEPRISSPEARMNRGAAQASMADLIDRTSIELDLVEAPLPPGPPAGPAPLQSNPRSPARHPDPELSERPDSIPSPHFDADPLSEPLGRSRSSHGADLGTEAPLAADDVGDEMDLDGKMIGRATTMPKPPPASAQSDTPKPGRPWKKYIFAVAVAGLATGAMLTLVPDIGPFGLNFVSDRVNKDLQNDALATARGLCQADLELDIATGADLAVVKVKTAQRSYPRHRATAGYAAYVAYVRGLRFGARAEDRAYGDMMVRVATTKQSDFLVLGQAAQDATTGQIARARQSMQGLLERRPDDIDVAVLAGEVELLAKGSDQATKVWQHAVDIKKIPRTLFGLSRAQFAASDLIGAEASAKKALELSPKHVGARTLLATIVWQNGAREAAALELLNKVTEDGDIRATAGDPELVAAYTQLGHIHLAKSRMSASEVAFAAALKIDPQAVNALVGNGELFYRSGRFSEAIARYEAAIRADADSVPAKIGMAKTQLFLERAKDSKDQLKKLCETRPNEPLAFYWLGRAEEMLGNKKEAETAYTSAIKVGADSPQTVEAYVALAQLLSSLGRAEDANARLTEASNRFPGLPALHRARGEVALATGNYADAKKEFETSLAREDDLATKFRLGIALRRMRAHDEAAKLFDVISQADKDFPGLALERGLLFEETGQTDQATEMYAKALQSAPNDLDLKLRVGSTQVMAGHAKQAEPILREVLKAKPNSAEVNHFLGRALLVRGISLAEAKRFLERAAEIDPNRAEYHLYVGWVANDLGETPQAESALKRAIELDRNLGDAYWQRGVLLQKQGQTIDALADLKIAIEKRPSRYDAYATMALCYQDQSRWAEAEEAWRKAISANGENAEWHYRLGKIYADRGNKTQAAPELDKAVALAEAPDKPSPGWLAGAHFLLGEAYRGTAADKAKKHYQRYLELAPQNHPYRVEAERALSSL